MFDKARGVDRPPKPRAPGEAPEELKLPTEFEHFDAPRPYDEGHHNADFGVEALESVEKKESTSLDLKRKLASIVRELESISPRGMQEIENYDANAYLAGRMKEYTDATKELLAPGKESPSNKEKAAEYSKHWKERAKELGEKLKPLWNGYKKAVDIYRKLHWTRKIAIAAALGGLSVATGGGGAWFYIIGAGMIGQRALGAGAAFASIEAIAEKRLKKKEAKTGKERTQRQITTKYIIAGAAAGLVGGGVVGHLGGAFLHEIFGSGVAEAHAGVPHAAAPPMESHPEYAPREVSDVSPRAPLAEIAAASTPDHVSVDSLPVEKGAGADKAFATLLERMHGQGHYALSDPNTPDAVKDILKHSPHRLSQIYGFTGTHHLTLQPGDKIVLNPDGKLLLVHEHGASHELVERPIEHTVVHKQPLYPHHRVSAQEVMERRETARLNLGQIAQPEPRPEIAPQPEAVQPESTHAPDMTAVQPEPPGPPHDLTQPEAAPTPEAHAAIPTSTDLGNHIVQSQLWSAYHGDDSLQLFNSAPAPGTMEVGFRNDLFSLMRASGVGPNEGEALEHYVSRAESAIDAAASSHTPVVQPGIFNVEGKLFAHGGDLSSRLVLAQEYVRLNPSAHIIVENPGTAHPFIQYPAQHIDVQIGTGTIGENAYVDAVVNPPDMGAYGQPLF